MDFNCNKKIYERIIDKKEIMPYQLDVWKWILKANVDLGDKFCNPFRSDKHGDCYLEEFKGIIRLVDWPDYHNYGATLHGSSCLDIIQKMHSCNFKEALQIAFYECLESKLQYLKPLTFVNKTNVNKSIGFFIEEETRNWSKKDLLFWTEKTGITVKDLEEEKCFPVKEFWYTSKQGRYVKDVPKTETYINLIDGKKKIYQPETRFWLTNFTNKHIGGYSEFYFEIGQPKILFLTKNLKSYLCIKNLVYNSRYTPNEGMLLEEDFINKINNQFDYVFILFDNDNAGIKASKKLEKQWFEVTNNNKAISCNFPTKYLEKTYINTFGQEKNVSDAFDICKKWGTDRLDIEINEIKKAIEDV